MLDVDCSQQALIGNAQPVGWNGRSPGADAEIVKFNEMSKRLKLRGYASTTTPKPERAFEPTEDTRPERTDAAPTSINASVDCRGDDQRVAEITA